MSILYASSEENISAGLKPVLRYTVDKTGINLIISHFTIRGIRYDKYFDLAAKSFFC